MKKTKILQTGSTLVNKFVLVVLSLYKTLVSPALYVLFGKGCRHEVTCSEFAMQSIEEFGVIKGGKRSLKRLSTCY